jgi:hypothetical protein
MQDYSPRIFAMPKSPASPRELARHTEYTRSYMLLVLGEMVYETDAQKELSLALQHRISYAPNMRQLLHLRGEWRRTIDTIRGPGKASWPLPHAMQY